MSKLCQYDWRWRNLRIDHTNLTIANFGCYLLCLSMLTNRDPRDVNKLFTDHGGYNNVGLIENDIAYKLVGMTYLGKVDVNPIQLCIGTTNYYANKVQPDARHFFVMKPDQTIVDPLTGKAGPNKYVNRMVSYRLFRYGV
jgi:hypothetical protein